MYICIASAGHMPMLADPAFCDLAAAIGRASLGADDKTIWVSGGSICTSGQEVYLPSGLRSLCEKCNTTTTLEETQMLDQ
jgi:hypothetical protein